MYKMDNLKDAALMAAEMLAHQSEECYKDTEPFKTSQEFDDKMNQLLETVENNNRYRKKRKAVRVIIVAAILVVVTVLTCVAIHNNDKPEKPYITKVYDTWTSVERVSVKNFLFYEFADYDFTAEYIPEGYELEEEVNNRYSCIRFYKNDEGHKITLCKGDSGGIANINTEQYPYEEVLINGNWTIIFYFDNCGTVEYSAMLFVDGFEYYVSGIKDKGELIKILENIN